MTHLQAFKRGLAYEVGDGRHVGFWEDIWCGDRPLKLDFPDIFAIAAHPTARVESYLSSHGGSVVWNLVLRNVFDWELSRVLDFMRRLYGSKVRVGIEDHRIWVSGK